MKFAAAIKKSITYLSSDEFKGRDDAETTVASIPTLIKINKGGFLTDNSQEGLILKGKNPETKKSYVIKERAYVSGFMPHAAAPKFVEHVNTFSDKVAFIIYSNPSPAFEKAFMSGPVDELPKVTLTISSLGQTPFKEDTKTFTSLPTKIVNFQKEAVHLNTSEPVDYVQVFDPQYGRKASAPNGLYKAILAGLSKAHK